MRANRRDVYEYLWRILADRPTRVSVNTDIGIALRTLSGDVVAWRWEVEISVEYRDASLRRTESRVTFEGQAPTLADASAVTLEVLDLLPGPASSVDTSGAERLIQAARQRAEQRHQAYMSLEHPGDVAADEMLRNAYNAYTTALNDETQAPQEDP